MTLTVGAGCRDAQIGSFGTISKFSRRDAKSDDRYTVDAGCRDAKTNGFGAILIRK